MRRAPEDQVEKALKALEKRSRSRDLREHDPFKRLGPVRFRVQYGEDRNGESAVWVYVIVNDDTPLGVRDVGPRLDARLRIREAVESSGWPNHVYTRFLRKSEEASG
jgi:hypothetical protein